MNSQKTPQYLKRTGELWGAFSEFFGEMIPLDIDSASCYIGPPFNESRLNMNEKSPLFLQRNCPLMQSWTGVGRKGIIDIYVCIINHMPTPLKKKNVFVAWTNSVGYESLILLWAMKRKCYFDEIVGTGFTGSCHFKTSDTASDTSSSKCYPFLFSGSKWRYISPFVWFSYQQSSRLLQKHCLWSSEETVVGLKKYATGARTQKNFNSA